MAHEITDTDNVVLHRERAWHGLGVVVQDAPTPTEALEIAGLDWQIDQLPLTGYVSDGDRIDLPHHVANFRTDTREVLAVVSSGYRPIQNRDIAEFAEALAEQGDVVRVESAGSVRGGKKVWFLLKGESFSVRGDDEVRPYICLANSHDGTNAFRATPTCIRVVCSNTLHMVVPDKDKAGALTASEAYAVKHVGDIKQRVEDAKAALKLYGRAVDSTRATFEDVAKRDVGGREKLQTFWMDVYQRLQGPVPTEPTDKQEKRAYDRATEAMGKIAERFDRERDLAGPTAWNALNAFTGWAQNDRTARGKDEQARQESRAHLNLFGKVAEASDEALGVALQTF